MIVVTFSPLVYNSYFYTDYLYEEPPHKGLFFPIVTAVARIDYTVFPVALSHTMIRDPRMSGHRCDTEKSQNDKTQLSQILTNTLSINMKH